MKHWTERFPEIYAEERDYWLGKGFTDLTSSRDEVSFEGLILVRRRGEDGLESARFEIRLDYLSGYPFQMPQVSFLQPRIERARHQGPNGHPCLFPPSVWDTNVRASELYAAIARWLNYYLDDHFPRELAIYELPEYFLRAPYAVLAPPEVMGSFAEKEKGSFSVSPLLGHDVSVLRSVDGNGVGRRLMSELAAHELWGDHAIGKWYRLDHEPSGMRHSEELEAELANSGHRVSLNARPDVGRHLVGLVFEDAVLNEERAILLDLGVKKKSQQHKVGEGWPLRLAELHLVSPQELQRRLQGVRDLEALGAKKVTIFGLGAVGSPLALSLAREGIGSFELCDPDLLRPGNVVRHALDLTSVGLYKTIAMEAALGRVNPGVGTRAQLENLGDPEVMSTCIADAHLVIAAVGDEVLEQLLCEVVFDLEDPPPVILVRTLHAGAAFRVILMRPGVDACFECVREYKSEKDPGWIEVPEDGLPDIFDSGCATAARPGAGLTCQQAAIFAAARALEVLEGRDREANHWLSVEQPISGGDSRLDEPLTLHKASFKPRSGCSNCAA